MMALTLLIYIYSLVFKLLYVVLTACCFLIQVPRIPPPAVPTGRVHVVVTVAFFCFLIKLLTCGFWGLCECDTDGCLVCSLFPVTSPI